MSSTGTTSSTSRACSPGTSTTLTGRGTQSAPAPFQRAPAEEAGDRLERALRRREPEPLRGNPGQFLEALQRDGEVSTPLGAGDGVDLVDDHPADRLEDASGRRSEDQEKRFGGGDEDVGGVPLHPSPLVGRGITGADSGDDLCRRRQTQSGRGVADPGERRPQVALHVVGESLHRRHIEHPAPLRRLGDRLVEQTVERPEEGGERLARAGGGMDEGVLAPGDNRPAQRLRLGWLGKGALEPCPRRRREPGHGVRGHHRHRRRMK